MSDYFQRLRHRIQPLPQQESRAVVSLEPPVSTAPIRYEPTGDVESWEEVEAPDIPQLPPDRSLPPQPVQPARSMVVMEPPPGTEPLNLTRPGVTIQASESTLIRPDVSTQTPKSMTPMLWEPVQQPSMVAVPARLPVEYPALSPAPRLETPQEPVVSPSTKLPALERSVPQEVVERVAQREVHTIERILERSSSPSLLPVREPVETLPDRRDITPPAASRAETASMQTLQPPQSPAWTPRPEPAPEPRVVIGQLLVEVVAPEPPAPKATTPPRTVIQHTPRPSHESGVSSPLRFGLGQL